MMCRVLFCLVESGGMNRRREHVHVRARVRVLVCSRLAHCTVLYNQYKLLIHITVYCVYVQYVCLYVCMNADLA